MASVVYILCGITSSVCAVLLFRQYQRTRGRLLFWSTWCFASLALPNVLLYVDLIMLPEIDLSLLRSSLTLAGMCMLLYGMIQEST